MKKNNAKTIVIKPEFFEDKEYGCVEYHTGNGSKKDKGKADKELRKIWGTVKQQARDYSTIKNTKIQVNERHYRYVCLIPRKQLKIDIEFPSVGPMKEETFQLYGPMTPKKKKELRKLLRKQKSRDTKDDPKTYDDLARLYRGVDIEKVIEHLEIASEKCKLCGYGNDIQAVNALTLAGDYRVSGKFEKALSKCSETKNCLDSPGLKLPVPQKNAMLEQVANIAKLSAVALAALCNCAENYEGAILHLSTAIDMQTCYDVDLLQFRGGTYLDADQYENAITDLNQVIKIAPKNVAALTDRGRCYCERGQYTSALKDVEMALSLNSKESRAQECKELIFQKLGGGGKERKHLLDDALKNEGREFARQKKTWKGAMGKPGPQLMKVMQRKEKESEAFKYNILNRKFALLFEEGKYQQAIQVGMKILDNLEEKNEKLTAVFCYKISEAYAAMEKYKLSMMYVEKAIAINEHDPVSHCMKAKILFYQKEEEEFLCEMTTIRDLQKEKLKQLEKDRQAPNPDQEALLVMAESMRVTSEYFCVLYSQYQASNMEKEKESIVELEKPDVFKIMLVASYAQAYPEESSHVLQFLMIAQVRGTLFVEPMKRKGIVKSKNKAAKKKFSKNYYGYFKDPGNKRRLSVEKKGNELWVGKEISFK